MENRLFIWVEKFKDALESERKEVKKLAIRIAVDENLKYKKKCYLFVGCRKEQDHLSDLSARNALIAYSFLKVLNCEVKEIILDKACGTEMLCNAWVLNSDMKACSGVWLNPSFLLSNREQRLSPAR